MTPKKRIMEGKNRIKGGGGRGGVKNDSKDWTSFMDDPLPDDILSSFLHFFHETSTIAMILGQSLMFKPLTQW